MMETSGSENPHFDWKQRNNISRSNQLTCHNCTSIQKVYSQKMLENSEEEQKSFFPSLEHVLAANRFSYDRHFLLQLITSRVLLASGAPENRSPSGFCSSMSSVFSAILAASSLRLKTCGEDSSRFSAINIFRALRVFRSLRSTFPYSSLICCSSLILISF